jgi:thiamine-phosphate pyrophosphorylase
VAIGGITAQRAPVVLAAGADSVAVITDIVTSEDPEQRTQNWLSATSRCPNFSTERPQGNGA